MQVQRSRNAERPTSEKIRCPTYSGMRIKISYSENLWLATAAVTAVTATTNAATVAATVASGATAANAAPASSTDPATAATLTATVAMNAVAATAAAAAGTATIIIIAPADAARGGGKGVGNGKCCVLCASVSAASQ